MLSSSSEELSDGRGVRFVIYDESSPVSVTEAINGWLNDTEFRNFFIDPLKDSQFPVFRNVEKTGVIYATSRAREHGFTATDPTWANMGQGAPETGFIEGER